MSEDSKGDDASYHDPTAPIPSSGSSPYPQGQAPQQGQTPQQGQPPAYGQPPTQDRPPRQGQYPAYGPNPYAQGPYAPPPYAGNPYGAVRQANTSAIVLVIVAGLSTLLSCLPAIPAVVFGIIALVKQDDEPPESRKFARWGWIAYAIGVAVYIVAVVGLIVLGILASRTPGSYPGAYGY